jgi:hypothetical protein
VAEEVQRLATKDGVTNPELEGVITEQMVRGMTHRRCRRSRGGWVTAALGHPHPGGRSQARFAALNACAHACRARQGLPALKLTLSLHLTRTALHQSCKTCRRRFWTVLRPWLTSRRRRAAPRAQTQAPQVCRGRFCGKTLKICWTSSSRVRGRAIGGACLRVGDAKLARQRA